MKPNNRYNINSLPSTSSNYSLPSSGPNTNPHPPKPVQSDYASSSRRPALPRDPKSSAHIVQPKETDRSIFHKKSKAHQLSINLRKGSPIKAEVDLFTTNSNSNLTSFQNFASFSNRFDDDIKPDELEIENHNPDHSGLLLRNSDDSNILSEIPHDQIRTMNEQVNESNYLSFSSKQNSAVKPRDTKNNNIKNTKYSDMYNAKNIKNAYSARN